MIEQIAAPERSDKSPSIDIPFLMARLTGRGPRVKLIALGLSAGMTREEITRALGICERTVRRAVKGL